MVRCKHRDKGQYFAAKFVRYTRKEERENVEREVQIMNSLAFWMCQRIPDLNLLLHIFSLLFSSVTYKFGGKILAFFMMFASDQVLYFKLYIGIFFTFQGQIWTSGPLQTS